MAKATTIKTADFEKAMDEALKKVDELKHTTEAAKKEVKNILRELYSDTVKETHTFEIMECLRR